MILNICNYIKKDIVGNTMEAYYIDEDIKEPINKLNVIQTNRDVKISVLTGESDKSRLNEIVDLSEIDDIPCGELQISVKSLRLHSEIISKRELELKIFNIIDNIPITNNFNRNDNVDYILHKSHIDIALKRHIGKLNLLINPSNHDITQSIQNQNIEVFYDSIIPLNKMFLFCKKGGHRTDIEVGLNIIESVDDYMLRDDLKRYFIANLKVEEVVKAIEIK